MSPLRRRRANSIGKHHGEMACEACSARFNLFKRKKQCMDCLRYFCSECVIKRLDKIVTCDSCGILSRRPLVRNQIREMRTKDLRQYLLAKQVSIKGCVEKEDLVHVLMLFANGTDPCLSTDYSANFRSRYAEEVLSRASPVSYESEGAQNVGAESNAAREEIQAEPDSTDIEITEEITESDSSPIISIPFSIDGNESSGEGSRRSGNIEIEEVFETDGNPVDVSIEPMITEQEEVSEASGEKQSDIVTEIPMWSDKVQLSDIKESSELEFLNIKQLKNLLSTNRVDYKGCIERQELLNRVSRLWQEYKQSRQDVEKLSEDELCKICWDAPIECVILECGHMACCINCGKQMSECPICKQYVVRVVRFFKA